MGAPGSVWDHVSPKSQQVKIRRPNPRPPADNSPAHTPSIPHPTTGPPSPTGPPATTKCRQKQYNISLKCSLGNISLLPLRNNNPPQLGSPQKGRKGGSRFTETHSTDPRIPLVTKTTFPLSSFHSHFPTLHTPIGRIASDQPSTPVISGNSLKKLAADWDIIIGLYSLLKIWI